MTGCRTVGRRAIFRPTVRLSDMTQHRTAVPWPQTSDRPTGPTTFHLVRNAIWEAVRHVRHRPSILSCGMDVNVRRVVSQPISGHFLNLALERITRCFRPKAVGRPHGNAAERLHQTGHSGLAQEQPLARVGDAGRVTVDRYCAPARRLTCAWTPSVSVRMNDADNGLVGSTLMNQTTDVR